ncbi:MAG: 30S ribosomal protein S6 [Chloroflexi bacterium]|nr:30S ribosomal protein S6 [Chloroflexota bacterium]
MRDYEMVFIARPAVEGEALQALIERLHDVINAGGEVLETDVWGKRELAYPIEKEREGMYFLIRARMDPNHVSEVERTIRYTDQIIRHLIVRVPE